MSTVYDSIVIVWRRRMVDVDTELEPLANNEVTPFLRELAAVYLEHDREAALLSALCDVVRVQNSRPVI